MSAGAGDDADAGPNAEDAAADVADIRPSADWTGSDQSEDGAAELSRDALYDTVTSTRKRYVFHALKQRNEPMDVGALAEQVAAWENGKSIEEITSEERKRVYVSLYQSHLESMATNGVVAYDEEDGTVTITPAAAEASVYMEIVSGSDIPWPWFYVGLAAVGAIVLGLVSLDFPFFTRVSGVTWAWIILIAFGAAAIVEAVRSRRMEFGDDGPPPELRD